MTAFGRRPDARRNKSSLPNPEKFWALLAGRASHQNVLWTPEDLAEYKKYYFQPATIHAICEDYRASTTIDAEHDRADLERGNKLTVPKVRVLWGAKGMLGTYEDVVRVWRDHAAAQVDVSGRPLECGHYIPEEQPEALLSEIQAFLV